MLKKLLKYDFKSVFRYWWIAAISSLALSVLGGFCITILNSERQLPTAVYIFPTLSMILVIVSYVVFAILSVILVYVRFYKNFFTDEGYLTFTLPVKRVELLNSKLILSVTTMIATVLVCVLDIIVMIAIGAWEQVFSAEFIRGFKEFWAALTLGVGWYLPIYIVEAILFLVMSVAFSTLFVFCCITFASIITKKAKVLCAIAIYYVANGIFTFFVQIFTMFGMQSLMTWLSKLPDTGGGEKPVLALIFMGMILFVAMFTALLYVLEHWMLDRKLNLS